MSNYEYDILLSYESREATNQSVDSSVVLLFDEESKRHHFQRILDDSSSHNDMSVFSQGNYIVKIFFKEVSDKTEFKNMLRDMMGNKKKEIIKEFLQSRPEDSRLETLVKESPFGLIGLFGTIQEAKRALHHHNERLKNRDDSETKIRNASKITRQKWIRSTRETLKALLSEDEDVCTGIADEIIEKTENAFIEELKTVRYPAVSYFPKYNQEKKQALVKAWIQEYKTNEDLKQVIIGQQLMSHEKFSYENAMSSVHDDGGAIFRAKYNARKKIKSRIYMDSLNRENFGHNIKQKIFSIESSGLQGSTEMKLSAIRKMDSIINDTSIANRIVGAEEYLISLIDFVAHSLLEIIACKFYMVESKIITSSANCRLINKERKPSKYWFDSIYAKEFEKIKRDWLQSH